MKNKTAMIRLVIGILMVSSFFYEMTSDRENTGVRREIGVSASETITVVPEIKKVALTFDDGPHPQYTEQLLDGLKARGVHASFFVTGEHAALHPDIILRMYEEGHLVGNHTYSHMQLRSDNRAEFKEELIKTNAVLKQITGESAQFVRPPYGSWDKEFETQLDMFPVLWTVDPLDWCSSDASCVTGRILQSAGDGDIILMHDYYDSSVTAALAVVDELLAQGYEFVTVDEILLD